MPVHDQSYRHYTGRRNPPGGTWRVIARTGVKAMLRKRLFLALLLLAWSQFIVRAVQIFVASSFPQASFLAASPATYRQFIAQQSIFVFFVTIYVGAGLIADDRRANALQVYLSKPMTRVEYVAGKFVILLVFLLGVTWWPAMLLLVFQVALDGPAFLGGHADLIPAITLFSAIEVIVSSLSVLALSSLSKSRRFVSILYAAIVLFTAAIAGVLRGITGSPALSWLSPEIALGVVGDAIFRVPSAREVPISLACLTLTLVVCGSLAILERRVRGVEVVT